MTTAIDQLLQSVLYSFL